MRQAQIDGERVAMFLADDAVRGALDALDAKCVAAWRLATTVEARERAHADVMALARFRDQLRVLVDRGVVAAHEEHLRE